MHAPPIVIVILTACANRAPRPAEPVAVAPSSAPAREPQCVLPTAPVAPLSQRDLEHEATPADDGVANDLLVGIWDGHAYDLDGELGQPGSDPRPAQPVSACFSARGLLATLADTPEHGPVAHLLAGDDDDDEDDNNDNHGESAPRPGCTPRSRTYTLRREPQAGNQLWLTIRTTGGCPGDASYASPYEHVFNVHRLDERVLVVSSGATAAVTAYRRR